MVARVLGWVLFTAWLTWSFALQSRFAAASAAGPYVPEIGLVLALAVLARLDEREAPILALVLALSRLAFCGEPVAALLAGSLGLVLLALAVRSVVELTGPLWRTVTTAALVAAFDLWLAVAHGARPVGVAAGVPVGFGSLLAAAFSSGFLALFAGPTLARLPGLTPLRSRRW
jgi:hypothetical protein